MSCCPFPVCFCCFTNTRLLPSANPTNLNQAFQPTGIPHRPQSAFSTSDTDSDSGENPLLDLERAVRLSTPFQNLPTHQQIPHPQSQGPSTHPTRTEDSTDSWTGDEEFFPFSKTHLPPTSTSTATPAKRIECPQPRRVVVGRKAVWENSVAIDRRDSATEMMGRGQVSASLSPNVTLRGGRSGRFARRAEVGRKTGGTEMAMQGVPLCMEEHPASVGSDGDDELGSSSE